MIKDANKSKIAIEVSDVCMRFNLSRHKITSLKEYLIRISRRELFFEEFWALRNISFSVEKGDVCGIIGLNGSGKSTLLKLIAGVMYPTIGSIQVNGTIAPMIELGAGFDLELTAKENVFMNGAVLGHNRQYMQERYKEIMEFSELWEFENTPVKNFSSGMYARLGFSIATSVNPNILIVDEILGVGDYLFQKKCAERISNMIKNKVTVLLVSHDISNIKELCNKVIWLEKGRMKMSGSAEEVTSLYE